MEALAEEVAQEIGHSDDVFTDNPDLDCLVVNVTLLKRIILAALRRVQVKDADTNPNKRGTDTSRVTATIEPSGE